MSLCDVFVYDSNDGLYALVILIISNKSVPQTVAEMRFCFYFCKKNSRGWEDCSSGKNPLSYKPSDLDSVLEPT